MARSTDGIEEGKRCKKGLGTLEYSSVGADQGFEQSYRDDLEAIGYVLIFFLNGTLPWKLEYKKLGYTKQQRRAKIAEIKRNITLEDLCFGIPSEFKAYMEYTKSLPFHKTGTAPDYEYMRHIFKKLAKRNSIKYDYKFDWCK